MTFQEYYILLLQELLKKRACLTAHIQILKDKKGSITCSEADILIIHQQSVGELERLSRSLYDQIQKGEIQLEDKALSFNDLFECS